MYGIVKKLDIDLQKQILQDCSSLLSAAPLYSNYAPRRGIGRRDCSGNCETCFTGGDLRQFKYKNTSFGTWGYHVRPCGARYVQDHHTTGEPFQIPGLLTSSRNQSESVSPSGNMNNPQKKGVQGTLVFPSFPKRWDG